MNVFEDDNTDRRSSDLPRASADAGDEIVPGATDRGVASGSAVSPSTGEEGAATARQRIVIVGEALAEALRPRLERCLPGVSVTVVSSFLFAMGELTRQGAEVVIGSADQLAGMAESASRCLREMLPDSRLVVVAQAHTQAEADAAVRGGFDARLDEPMTDAGIATALGLADTASSPAQQASQHPSQPGDDTDDHLTQPGSDSPSDLSEEPSPAADDEAAAVMLGDIDLIETLLGSSERFNELALRLVAQRSGIAGIGWAGNPEGVPADHIPVRVIYQGRSYGILHAPASAPVHTLASWAGWLGRWLALRQRMRQLETLSMKDEMTGVWNRRYFNRFLHHILDQAQVRRSQVTLLVFDIDDFKCYNDRFGHAAGDEILRETARLMQSFVREHDVVARIGGDEFAVIFWDAEEKRRPDSAHPQSVRQAAQRFQKAICSHRFPKLLDQVPDTLTISGGLASYPWDGSTPVELLERADAMALQSKRQGKNVITFGPSARGEHHTCSQQSPDD